jgi:hypothetical protein
MRGINLLRERCQNEKSSIVRSKEYLDLVDLRNIEKLDSLIRACERAESIKINWHYNLKGEKVLWN